MTAPLAACQHAGRKRGSGNAVSRILDAAEMEFSLKGLVEGRIQDIATRAGVSKQIVYHYFETKEDLYRVVLDRITQRHEPMTVLRDYDGMPADDALILFIDRLFEIQACNGGHLIIDLAQHRSGHFQRSRLGGKLIDKFLRCLEQIVARGKAEECFHDEVDARQLCLMINIVTNGAVAFGPFVADMIEQMPGLSIKSSAIAFILSSVRAYPASPVVRASEVVTVG